MMFVVIISAVSEWRNVLEVLNPHDLQNSPYGEWFTHDAGGRDVVVIHGGWGKIAAAASAQYAVERWKPEVILNLGTCGGLHSRTAAGDLVLVERALVSDLVVEIGDLEEEEALYRTDLFLPPDLESSLPWPVLRGTIASGDRDVAREDVRRLIERYDALAADWESASIAFVAGRNNVPCVIIRGVSDVVGEDHAEAYDGREHIFHDRTADVMQRLLVELPPLLDGLAMLEWSHR